MFTVVISPEAKDVLEKRGQQYGFVQPGIMIHRQGTKADVSRTRDGGTVWTIQQPESPWSFHLGSFEDYPDAEYQLIDGMRVYLAIIPRQGERGVAIRLKNGEPVIEPLGSDQQ